MLLLYSTQSSINSKISIQIEKAKPAFISLTIININKDDCSKCFNISKVIDYVKNSKKTIINETINENYKNNLIQNEIKKFNITKFPALIIKGDINKSTYLTSNLQRIAKKINDTTYIFMPKEAPYLNRKGNIIGKVSLIGLYDKNCTSCYNINLLLNNVESTNIYFGNITKIPISSVKGKYLISKYNITKIPTLLFSNELKNYNLIVNDWQKNIGTIEKDGVYIIRNVNLPYFNIKENKTIGKIQITILKDKDCKNCFNASKIYSIIMNKLEVTTFNTTLLTTDSKEGQVLTKRYNLTKFPALIIKGDTNSYPKIKEVWGQAGIVVNGSYIFKNIEIIKEPYFDINKGEITPNKN